LICDIVVLHARHYNDNVRHRCITIAILKQVYEESLNSLVYFLGGPKKKSVVTSNQFEKKDPTLIIHTKLVWTGLKSPMTSSIWIRLLSAKTTTNGWMQWSLLLWKQGVSQRKKNTHTHYIYIYGKWMDSSQVNG
jgi:hypothetical protein